MRIFLGADHGGFKLKNKIKLWLEEQNYQVEDMGAAVLDPKDDYPVYAIEVARQVVKDGQARGLLFCRSGAGMAIAANKIKGIRAAEAWDERSAKHARQHNKANVLSLGADWMNFNQAKKIIKVFFETEFSQADRHQKRIELISQLEN